MNNSEFGYIRWVKLLVEGGNDGRVKPIKPRVTLGILAGKNPQGLYRMICVGFEAPDGEYNTMTPAGIENVAVDPAAFTGLTSEMIKLVGGTQFFRLKDGKLEETCYELATRAVQRLRIDACVKLDGLEQNLRQAQRRIASGMAEFEPIPTKPCKVRIGDEMFPGVREAYTLVRGGRIELVPLYRRSFQASNDNAIVLS